MLKAIKNFLPQIIIFLVIFAFFGDLIISSKIFVTPDFGRSDFVHFNIPIRQVYQQSIRNFELPFWEPNIGGGYPLSAEGQVGALYPPNLFFFFLFPFWLAFNLNLTFTFLVASYGAYFLARSQNISKYASALSAIVFGLSPMMILHVQHYNLIQTMSIFPWQLFFINEFFKKNKSVFLLLFGLVTTMQIFAGFAQLTTYSLFASFLFFMWKLKFLQTKMFTKVKIFIFLQIVLFLSITSTLVQLYPTYELAKEAKRGEIVTPQKILQEFPFKFQNLLGIFDPNIFGNPKEGTYPVFKTGKWGIFWENTVYTGLIPLILVPTYTISLVFKKSKKGINSSMFFLAIGLVGLLLALGNSAPLHPMFSFPPFSYFRVPARFLMYVFLSASILTGFSLDKLLNKTKRDSLKKTISVIIILVFALDIFINWYSYNLKEPISVFQKSPEFANEIKDGRLTSIGFEVKWTDIFAKEGWEGKESFYNFQRNGLAQNSNLTHNIAQLKAYGGMFPKRLSLVESMSEEFTKVEDSKLKVDNPSQNIFNAYNVKFITTPRELNSEDWELLAKVGQKEETVYLYKNKNETSRAYIANRYKTTDTISGFIQNLEETSDITKTPILEKNVEIVNNNEPQGTAQIIKDSKNSIEIQTNVKEKSLLILADTYYPGWKAYINGQSAEIIPANLNSKAVIVPRGVSTVAFIFHQNYFKRLALISTISLIMVLTLLILRKKMDNFLF